MRLRRMISDVILDELFRQMNWISWMHNNQDIKESMLYKTYELAVAWSKLKLDILTAV